MICKEVAYIHSGEFEWAKRGKDQWLKNIFNSPALTVKPKSTLSIRQYVRSKLTLDGWSDEIRIANGYEMTIFSIKDDLAFHLQTGNISRAPYDLLKLQYLYLERKINAAALALPSKVAANNIGSNIASFERVYNELQILDRIITVPLFLISFE